jgi:hypothetical protein
MEISFQKSLCVAGNNWEQVTHSFCAVRARVFVAENRQLFRALMGRAGDENFVPFLRSDAKQ